MMYTKLITAVMLVTAGWAYSLTTQELITARDGFESRRDAAFEKLRGKPLVIAAKLPPLSPGRGDFTRAFSYSITDFAMRAMWLNEQIDTANEALRINSQHYIDDKLCRNDRDSFYWAADVVCRIVEFFGRNGTIAPGRLTAETEDLILEMMWVYAKENSKVDSLDDVYYIYSIWRWGQMGDAPIPASAEIQRSQTWDVLESENHHAMKVSTLWHFAKLLNLSPAYNQLVFEDGFTAAAHYAAWTDYAKEYCRQRAKKGLFLEMADGSYNAHTLKGIYNFYDFADDNDLRVLSGSLLTLHHASWAQEQINGVRGGGKSRMNGTKGSRATTPINHYMWYYTGMGSASTPVQEIFTVMTSQHRLPLVVIDLLLDVQGKGNYELIECPLGLAKDGHYGNPHYKLRTDYGGIVRYSYCTPDFILGMPLIESRPREHWVSISSQSRWLGAIFGNNLNARIYPWCEPTSGDTFNQMWGVQRKGTLIAQKLTTSTNAGDMRVYFSSASSGITITEEGGWVFARFPNAFAAVRPAWGTYSWDDANWMRFSASMAPVIMEVCQSSDFSGVFSLFKNAVLAQTVNVSSGVLTYTGLKGSGDFTFYTQSTTLPKIDGVPINLMPDHTFQSPFINQQRDSGVVTIEKDGRDIVLDFNTAQAVGCGDWGYFTYDLNSDCIVDIKDFLILADDWLFDKSVITSGSDDYPNITETGWPLPGNYNIPRASVVPTIDGVISPGEWMDARTIEMVHPALVTRPNTGTYGTGYAAPSSPADLSLYWYIKWDDDYLYLAAVIYDDIHISEVGKDVALLSFNFNNNPAATFPSGFFLWIMGADGTLAPFYTPGPKGSLLQGSLHPGHKILEARFPWSDFDFGTGYSPNVNDVHGFGLAFLDHDAGGVQKNYVLDYGSGTFAMTTVSTWNKITLVEEMPFGEAGVSYVDYNNDGKVDFVDYMRLADDWLLCSHPLGVGCVNAE